MDLDNDELNATNNQQIDVKNMHDDLCKYMDLYDRQYKRNETLELIIRKMANDLFGQVYHRDATYEEIQSIIKEYEEKIKDEDLIF